jgi:ATP-binding cassette subfamily B protein
MEPLGAREEQTSPAGPEAAPAGPSAVALRLENVAVRAAGHTILEDVNLEIPAGSHVGIVGPSGAGKSSLVGILLGWWQPAAGRVLVDGEPLQERLEQLRRHTAWVDPEVHLWNHTFFENIRYGTTGGAGRPMAQVIQTADLRRVLEKLPDGFETRLGEGGAMVSGGEGQRVRLARALFRRETRLVILDEPFRGLDRQQRGELLRRVRRLFEGVTLLCVTHDVSETEAFDRVLVVEGGRIVEDDAPAVLGGKLDSRYRALLEAENALRHGALSGAAWRHMRLEDGTLQGGLG